MDLLDKVDVSYPEPRARHEDNFIGSGGQNTWIGSGASSITISVSTTQFNPSRWWCVTGASREPVTISGANIIEEWVFEQGVANGYYFFFIIVHTSGNFFVNCTDGAHLRAGSYKDVEGWTVDNVYMAGGQYGATYNGTVSGTDKLLAVATVTGQEFGTNGDYNHYIDVTTDDEYNTLETFPDLVNTGADAVNGLRFMTAESNYSVEWSLNPADITDGSIYNGIMGFVIECSHPDPYTRAYNYISGPSPTAVVSDTRTVVATQHVYTKETSTNVLTLLSTNPNTGEVAILDRYEMPVSLGGSAANEFVSITGYSDEELLVVLRHSESLGESFVRKMYRVSIASDTISILNEEVLGGSFRPWNSGILNETYGYWSNSGYMQAVELSTGTLKPLLTLASSSDKSFPTSDSEVLFWSRSGSSINLWVHEFNATYDGQTNTVTDSVDLTSWISSVEAEINTLYDATYTRSYSTYNYSQFAVIPDKDGISVVVTFGYPYDSTNPSEYAEIPVPVILKLDYDGTSFSIGNHRLIQGDFFDWDRELYLNGGMPVVKPVVSSRGTYEYENIHSAILIYESYAYWNDSIDPDTLNSYQGALVYRVGLETSDYDSGNVLDKGIYSEEPAGYAGYYDPTMFNYFDINSQIGHYSPSSLNMTTSVVCFAEELGPSGAYADDDEAQYQHWEDEHYIWVGTLYALYELPPEPVEPTIYVPYWTMRSVTINYDGGLSSSMQVQKLFMEQVLPALYYTVDEFVIDDEAEINSSVWAMDNNGEYFTLITSKTYPAPIVQQIHLIRRVDDSLEVLDTITSPYSEPYFVLSSLEVVSVTDTKQLAMFANGSANGSHHGVWGFFIERSGSSLSMTPFVRITTELDVESYSSVKMHLIGNDRVIACYSTDDGIDISLVDGISTNTLSRTTVYSVPIIANFLLYETSFRPVNDTSETHYWISTENDEVLETCLIKVDGDTVSMTDQITLEIDMSSFSESDPLDLLGMSTQDYISAYIPWDDASSNNGTTAVNGDYFMFLGGFEEGRSITSGDHNGSYYYRERSELIVILRNGDSISLLSRTPIADTYGEYPPGFDKGLWNLYAHGIIDTTGQNRMLITYSFNSNIDYTGTELEYPYMHKLASYKLNGDGSITAQVPVVKDGADIFEADKTTAKEIGGHSSSGGVANTYFYYDYIIYVQQEHIQFNPNIRKDALVLAKRQEVIIPEV